MSDFKCDKCEKGIGFYDLALLGSVDDDCSPMTDMITLCRTCIHDRLEEITTEMDIPEMRRRDGRWLERNMLIRNSYHERFNEALLVIKAIQDQGVTDIKKK